MLIVSRHFASIRHLSTEAGSAKAFISYHICNHLKVNLLYCRQTFSEDGGMSVRDRGCSITTCTSRLNVDDTCK